MEAERHLPKTAILGASGFIGEYIWKDYLRFQPDCLGTASKGLKPGLEIFDLRSDPAALNLAERGYEEVIIAGARSLVGDCQNNPEETYEVNVTGTLRFIEHCRASNIRIIFLSSDYVFPGTTGGYTEDSTPGPTTEYGRQKWAVEQQLAEWGGDTLVVRLSKIYGLRKGDGTLLDELVDNLIHNRPVRVANDQFFSPTWVGDVVGALKAILSRKLRGTIHLCSPEPASRHMLAQALTKELQTDPELVEGIGLHEYPGMAYRPLDTSMKANRLKSETAYSFLTLQSAVEKIAEAWRS